MNKKEFIETLIDMGGCGAKPKSWARGWDDAIGEVIGITEELDEPEKPVIPQFVADWIERQKQPDWDYDKKEDALADSIHFTLYSLEANYPETNHDVVLRKPVNEWLNDDRKNYWKLIDGVRYGYEVEKEKTYIVDIEGILFLAKFDDEPDVDAYGETILYNDDYIIELTEKEIKDYDERYWAFAQEVCHV